MHGNPPLRLLQLSVIGACSLLVAAALLVGWPMLQEEQPPLHTAGPAAVGLLATSRPSPQLPPALVGRSSWGAATPTPPATHDTTWVQTLRTTPLWSRPDSSQETIAQLPEGYPLKISGTQGQRLLVFYGGGLRDQPATEGWVDQSAVAPAPAPKWVTTRWRSDFRTGQGGGGAEPLAGGSVLQVLEDRGRDVRALYLGDGRNRDAVEGWVKASDLGAAGTMLAAEGRGLKLLTAPEVAALRIGNGVWAKVPYRSQLDGSPAEDANCGPASVGMAIEAFRAYVSTDQLRSVANRLQGTSGSDYGFGIQFLAGLADQFGLKTQDLYTGQAFHRWTLEDVEAHLSLGHLVIPELRFRLMPGRSTSSSWDDHYVVITGMLGDRFIYNDSVDSDGPGYGRVMSGEEFARAWGGSDFPFAAFALARP